MKTSTIYGLFFITILQMSCHNESNHKNHSQQKEQLSKEDSLYKAVIAFHDEVMPKMGKLAGYQKTVEAKIDSLTKALVNKKDAAGHALKARYEELLTQLKAAEKGMNNWMDSFEPEPKLPSKDALEKYWEAEHAKAKKMRDDFKAALDSANAGLQ